MAFSDAFFRSPPRNESTASAGRSNQSSLIVSRRSTFGKNPHSFSDFPTNVDHPRSDRCTAIFEKALFAPASWISDAGRPFRRP